MVPDGYARLLTKTTYETLYKPHTFFKALYTHSFALFLYFLPLFLHLTLRHHAASSDGSVVIMAPAKLRRSGVSGPGRLDCEHCHYEYCVLLDDVTVVYSVTNHMYTRTG